MAFHLFKGIYKVYMRLLFYSHSSTLYGASTSLVNLISGIKSQDPIIELHVVIPGEGPLSNYLKDENISFSIIPHYFWIYNLELSNRKKKQNYLLWKIWFLKNKWEKRLKNRFYFNRHKEFVKEYAPDNIYVNSSLAPMGAKVASHLKIPYIWHHREPLNDLAYGYYLEYPQQFNRYFYKAVLHIYTSLFLKSTFPKTQNDLVVYNGVNFKYKKYINDRPSSISALKFGVVGRINSQKGQEGVVSVFKNLIEKYKNKGFDHELHIIGEGEKYYINQIKNSLEGQKIYFKGFLMPDEIFKEIDYLIVNANNEAFGRVVAEANFYGIPVIARASGALTEIVTPGINGFLYNDPVELSEILEKLIFDFDNLEYRKLSINSRKEFEEKFSIQDHARKILLTIKEMNIQ